MAQLTWRKSSFSEGHADTCVEVAADSAGIRHLREGDVPERVIVTTPVAFRAFIRAVRAEEFGGR
ncbi:DUF397 domain-containing protein [Streptomyces sp. NPDC057654]|uniref:DUF397 domain-containing protein n=1 Tax=Streptomyces sp. NPDC057654 TaxID=3346196 RepID=UPI0036B67A28